VSLNATAHCSRSRYLQVSRVSTLAKMTWSSPGSLPTSLLAGTPFAILITILVTLTLPLLLHLFLYRSAASTTALPTFVLLGPSGSGKTSFLTLVRLLHSSTHLYNILTNRTSSSEHLPNPPLTNANPKPASLKPP
jgi:signal recognition particle receptor subunit beta